MMRAAAAAVAHRLSKLATMTTTTTTMMMCMWMWMWMWMWMRMRIIILIIIMICSERASKLRAKRGQLPSVQ